MKCMLCNQEVEEQEEHLKDKIRNIPDFQTYEEALSQIIIITNDKRSHLMYIDAINWERVKMKAIKKIAKNILVKKKADRRT